MFFLPFSPNFRRDENPTPAAAKRERRPVSFARMPLIISELSVPPFI